MSKVGIRNQLDVFAFPIRIAITAIIPLVLIGGAFDWIYLNNQEYAIDFFSAQVSYVESYISGFVICVIEIAAALYFLNKYELIRKGSFTRSWFLPSFIVGLVASLIYVIGELASGISSTSIQGPAIYQLMYLELAPQSLDYGNAVAIGLTIFGLALLLKVLFAINPLPTINKSQTPDSTNLAVTAPGLVGGVWAGFVTTASAMLCCGPLPGAIALASGMSSIYFSDLINLQPILAILGVPVLIISLIFADKRARSYCELRR